jgi:hypothetical protein
MTIALYLGTTAYALIAGFVFAFKLRDRKWYHKFYPDRTWVTVAIGVVLGGAPWAWLWLWNITLTPWFVIILYSTIFLSIGIPIIWEEARNASEFAAKAKKIRGA